MNWKPGDDPEREHKLYFPHCDFLKEKREKDDVENGITILIILNNTILKNHNCLRIFKYMFKKHNYKFYFS